MAAHLRSIIRRYDSGNHFSPSFSQLSAARPFCSSSRPSIPLSPDQALHPSQVNSLLDYVVPVAKAALVVAFGVGIDVMGVRTNHKILNIKVESEGRRVLLTDIAMLQREIDTVKMRRSGRCDTDTNGVDPKNERSGSWSVFKMR